MKVDSTSRTCAVQRYVELGFILIGCSACSRLHLLPFPLIEFLQELQLLRHDAKASTLKFRGWRTQPTPHDRLLPITIIPESSSPGYRISPVDLKVTRCTSRVRTSRNACSKFARNATFERGPGTKTRTATWARPDATRTGHSRGFAQRLSVLRSEVVDLVVITLIITIRT